MTVRIGANPTALMVQRHLSFATAAVSSANERLSSGLRINRAADDAAGLAVSSGLGLASRVYGQALRNVSDGVSAVSIAEAALRECQNIAIRQRELASQAANGVLSGDQRAALHHEATELVKEYNRIMSSTEFNGRGLFGNDSIQLQSGFGLEEGLEFTTGGQLQSAVSDGTYAQRVITSNPITLDLEAGDFNEDGITDFAAAGWLSPVPAAPGGLFVYQGNGDGTFKFSNLYQSTGPGKPTEIAIADLDNDGNADVISATNTVIPGAFVNIIYGNGDGTFRSAVSITTPTNAVYVVAGDLDANGTQDLLVRSGLFLWGVMKGNGDGTFSSGPVVSIMPNSQTSYAFGDYNGDGRLDLVTGDSLTNTISYLTGVGDGTFVTQRTISTPAVPSSISVADIDQDGAFDIAASFSASSQVSIFEAFAEPGELISKTYSSSLTAPKVQTADMDGDGLNDLLLSSGSSMQIGKSSIDGIISWNGTVPIFGSSSPVLADFNGDRVTDVVSATNGVIGITLAGSTNSPQLKYINLQTVSGSREAMTYLDNVLKKISRQMGDLGAIESRLGTILQTVQVKRENYEEARSRITDVDIATESARAVKSQITQQVATAIAAQANQAPALVLGLIQGMG